MDQWQLQITVAECCDFSHAVATGGERVEARDQRDRELSQWPKVCVRVSIEEHTHARVTLQSRVGDRRAVSVRRMAVFTTNQLVVNPREDADSLGGKTTGRDS